MKVRTILIICLILPLLFSCDREVLGKVFIQGGMDSASPLVETAMDPDETLEDAVEKRMAEKAYKARVEELSPTTTCVELLSVEDRTLPDEIIVRLETPIINSTELDLSQMEDINASLSSIHDEEKAIKGSVDEINGTLSSIHDEEKAIIGEMNSTLLTIEEGVTSLTSEVKKVEGSLLMMNQNLKEALERPVSVTVESYERKEESPVALSEVVMEETDASITEDKRVVILGIVYAYDSSLSGYSVVGIEEGDTLIIKSEIDGIPVVKIGDEAFIYSSLRGDVVLPSSIKAIGDRAFYRSSKLDGRIYLPSSLENIGEEAFYGCDKLMGDLVIPDSVRFIGDRAFADSGVGKRVYGGKGLLEIGKDAFKGSGIDYSVLLPPISTILGL
ncbi:MAG: leucine-rich repeat domain-containing protein [Candidatus Ornithospirochaeta sp.]|nr:leucine-rich repeat domain-containing protein [Sphaerochaetaceae bacterium]MDY5522919.1 leucine-rich repeat domain-containing protein [Candidatus Ornithospirochaeta sp.]